MEHKIFDKTLKELFSRPELVKNFLQGFVDEDFVEDIDFKKIEKKNTNFITEIFKERATDLAIKLNMKGGKCAYLYILFEFQSTIDKIMPLRILNYMLLLYDDLIKQKEINIDEPLPPVFPLVLYTGEETYNAPTQLEELIAMPYERLQRYVPTFEHYLVTTRSKPREELKRLTALDNLIAGFFYFLTAGTKEEIKDAAETVGNMIDYSTDLGRFYAMWLKKYLKHKGIKMEIHPKEGGKVMLETAVENIRKEGRTEGIKEGKKEGICIGQQESVLKILNKRFGDTPQTIKNKIKNIFNVKKLEEILLAILDINSPEEVEKYLE